MAEAADQHTPREWALPDLLEYLTLAPFGYSINRALREMSQAIATGKLPLKREYYVDGKFHADWLDPFRFHLNYTLELDRVTAVVRVAKRGWLPGETSFHYSVAEQDVLALWPPCPPTSLPAPDRQPEHKAGPTKAWITDEAIRLKKAGEIPKDIERKTDFAKLLEERMRIAAKTNKSIRVVGWKYLRNNLRAWGLWPIGSIKIP